MGLWNSLHASPFKHAYHHPSYSSSALFYLFMVLIFIANSGTALIEDKEIEISKKKAQSLWTFTFAKGGKFDSSIQFLKRIEKNATIEILLCHEVELGSPAFYDRNTFITETWCDTPSDPICKFQLSIGDEDNQNNQNDVFNEKNPISYKFLPRGKYELIVINCEKEPFKATLHIVAQNPGGEYLSMNDVPYPTLYAVCTISWIVLLLFWIFRVYQYRIWNIHLQKAMTIIPIFQVVICFLTMISWKEKSRTGYSNDAVETLVFQCDIFYEGAEFAIFILLAMGWMITRGNLNRLEKRKIRVIIFLWIVARETYKAFRSFSFFFLIIMYVMLIRHIFYHIKMNLVDLRRQQHYLSNFPISPQSPLLVKLRMFKRYQRCLVAFFLIPLVSSLIGQILLFNALWIESAMNEIINGCMAIAIGYNFGLTSFAPCYYRIDDESSDIENDEPSSMMDMYQQGMIWRTGMPRPDQLLNSGGWFGSYREPKQHILVVHPGNGTSLSLAKYVRSTSDEYLPIPPPLEPGMSINIHIDDPKSDLPLL